MKNSANVRVTPGPAGPAAPCAQLTSTDVSFPGSTTTLTRPCASGVTGWPPIRTDTPAPVTVSVSEVPVAAGAWVTERPAGSGSGLWDSLTSDAFCSTGSPGLGSSFLGSSFFGSSFLGSSFLGSSFFGSSLSGSSASTVLSSFPGARVGSNHLASRSSLKKSRAHFSWSRSSASSVKLSTLMVMAPSLTRDSKAASRPALKNMYWPSSVPPKYV